MQLSVLVPGIRTKNWNALYESVNQSFSGKWEIIFVGPYELPQILKNKENITYIQDWGTPTRCQQLALIEAKGEYFTWAADDGGFLPGALDIAFTKVRQGKSLVMGKYLEGNGPNDHMRDNPYYVLRTHTSKDYRHIDPKYYMLNVGIVPTELVRYLGGYDCRFEACPIAYNDLSVRLQDYGVNYTIQDELMFTCNHMPGRTGDHAPIHDAQTQHDQPLFDQIYKYGFPYKGPSGRGRIPINNWKESPDRWTRRFS